MEHARTAGQLRRWYRDIDVSIGYKGGANGDSGVPGLGGFILLRAPVAD